MKLEFRLLVVDDNPGSIDDAVEILRDHLDSKGFSLNYRVSPDLSDAGLRSLARQAGRDFDLVAIDYNLGRGDTNGAVAAAQMRHELQFTDIVFYSSDPSVDLFTELARQQVAGVFIAGRQELDDALKGLADTVIGKAVDLNHMRGIAMAEVAEMDVLMEETLERVFSSDDTKIEKKAQETLQKLLESADKSLAKLKKLIATNKTLDVVTNSLIFSSMHKYMAINRVTSCLTERPTSAINALRSYDEDIIKNRNTLAHAKEVPLDGDAIGLRSIKRGQAPVVIDEAWMISFRGKLRVQRAALVAVCDALGRHVDSLNGQELKKGKS